VLFEGVFVAYQQQQQQQQQQRQQHSVACTLIQFKVNLHRQKHMQAVSTTCSSMNQVRPSAVRPVVLPTCTAVTTLPVICTVLALD
jgi:hypothetical protein